MRTLLIFYFFAFSFILNAQTTISGYLKNNINGNPIQFANLGIVGESVGTVSDESGKFDLTISEEKIEGKFMITSIGYKSKTYTSIEEFSNFIKENNTVLMEEEVGFLNEIVVNIPKYSKKKKNRKEKVKYTIGFNSGKLGNEIAIKKNVQSTSKLKSLHFSIGENENEKAVFRINVYKTKEGLPNKNITNQNIIIEIQDYQKGMIDVDLSTYNIKVDGEYIVSFECIKKINKLSFVAEKEASLFRGLSHDNWKETPFSIECDVVYY